MNDCPRADVRDLLPDLVNDRLDPRTRADVERHVAECGDCAEELALLRGVRPLLARTPAVDVARVADAVRAARAAAAASATPTPVRAVPAYWMRLAAAISLLLGGATALLLWSRAQEATAPERTAVVVEPTGVIDSNGVPAPAPRPTPATAEPVRAPAIVAQADGIVFGGGVADLADADLEALLGDLERLDVLTEVEPQPVQIEMGEGL